MDHQRANALCGLQVLPNNGHWCGLTAAGQHLAAAGARVVADPLRRRAEMRLGVETLDAVVRCTPESLITPSPRHSLSPLRQNTSAMADCASGLPAHRAPPGDTGSPVAVPRYCLLNQHHRALQ